MVHCNEFTRGLIEKLIWEWVANTKGSLYHVVEFLNNMILEVIREDFECRADLEACGREAMKVYRKDLKRRYKKVKGES